MQSFWETDSLLYNDISIVGAGILGLWTAYELSLKYPNAKIAIYERELYAAGATSRNAGFACFGSLTEILTDRKQWGDKKTLEIIKNRWLGIQAIQSLIGDEIDYHNYGGYELLFDDKIDSKIIDEVNDFLYPIFGQVVFQLVKNRLCDFGFGNEVIQLLYNSLEGQLHSGKLISALHQRIRSRNISFFSNSEITDYNSGEEVTLEVNGKTKVNTNKLIFCTNAFLPDQSLLIKPGRGQVLITEPVLDLPWKGCFHFHEGYYYFRNVGNRILFGGGRHLDFEKESTTEFELNQKIQEDLINKLHTIISPNKRLEIEQQWSGIMAFSENKLPKILQLGQNTIYAMNCNGMGVSLSPITALEIAKLN